MPRAHLCTSCGEDLAFIAPAREPHYGWPMVRCPACAAPSVRWEGHERRSWRRLRKRAKALAGALGRVAVFALLTVLTLSATMTLTEEARMLRISAGVPGPLALLGLSIASDAGTNIRGTLAEQRADWFDQVQNIFLLAGWMFSSLLAAAFLTGLLRHRRWWAVITAWGVWMFGVWATMFLAVPIVGRWVAPEETHWNGLIAKSLIDTFDIATWCAAFTAMALLFAPAAFVARSTVRKLIHRQRWKTRRRIRKWRQTA